ncbi:polysaccharide deacetylase family protein [Pseudochryseolinea flava]|uniref:Polysaccharide deacetylase-like protein n=1 Tax=Pseudochryseolinea flava TaxID=2059302 RepID=A0A364Y1Z3_9BACT|nr:polysaccharide deacetylase family protein [Pseudochryseolinea flava]RAW00758.1 polysaccharide deacetylase-like protein [Pseudochryseolinea flava]
MKKILLLSFCLMSLVALAQKKQVCFTYDDLPFVGYGLVDSVEQHKLSEKLIESLKQNRIPAIGFVNESKLYNSGVEIPHQVRMLQLWPSNGLELGNHTFSHPDYNKLNYVAFTEEIIKGEKVTKRLLSEKGMTIRYFRHPFLHTGDTKFKSDSLTNFLTARGYTVAPVTIDNDDYLFALAYARASSKKDEKLMMQIGADYVAYMEKKLLYFERQSTNLFGRNISHVLLLHSSKLNADYTDALAKMFIKNGYDFVSLSEAMKDSAYTSAISVFGKWGISWIDRWALSAGKKNDFFKEDPATPTYIADLAR